MPTPSIMNYVQYMYAKLCKLEYGVDYQAHVARAHAKLHVDVPLTRTSSIAAQFCSLPRTLYG